MLIQILTQRPEMIVAIISRTPTYVWGILAALVWLGATQMFTRTAKLQRMAIMPFSLLGLSIFGIVSAFGSSGQLVAVAGVWLLTAAAVTAIGLYGTPAAGTRYDAATRSFHLPGSVMPLLLILGIFLTKYAVAVELSMQPLLTHDTRFGLAIAVVYGVFNGVIMSRILRTLRLAMGDRGASARLATAG